MLDRIVRSFRGHSALGLDTDTRRLQILEGRINLSSGKAASQGLNGPLSTRALFRPPQTVSGSRIEFSGGGAA
eukprot:1179651-Prorocentrum_minimum.AAC.3